MAAFALATLAAFAVFFVSCNNAISQVSKGVSSPDRRVKPIRISADACPHLRLVRASAEAAGKPWTAVLNGPATGQDAATWRDFATQLASRLATFELTLRDSIPRVPKLVAIDLQSVFERV